VHVANVCEGALEKTIKRETLQARRDGNVESIEEKNTRTRVTSLDKRCTTNQGEQLRVFMDHRQRGDTTQQDHPALQNRTAQTVAGTRQPSTGARLVLNHRCEERGKAGEVKVRTAARLGFV
jgi:hypothetical protein